MFKGLGNIASLLNQARNIGGKMDGVTEKLKGQRVTGSAGGDMVKVHANGLGQVLGVEIDPVLKKRNDLEMVTDLLPAAINDAASKAKALHVQAMQELTGGIDLPAGLDETFRKMLGGHDDGDSTPPDNSN